MSPVVTSLVEVHCLMCDHWFRWSKPVGYAPKAPCCPRCFSSKTEAR